MILLLTVVMCGSSHLALSRTSTTNPLGLINSYLSYLLILCFLRVYIYIV